MNLLKVVRELFHPYLDDEKPPLHVGEAYHLWYFKIGVENTLKSAQVGFNVSQDSELKERITDLIENVLKPIKEDFLRCEAVPLPDVTPEKSLFPTSSTLSEHLKLNDEELANQLSWAMLMGIQIAVRGLTETVRTDVGALFAKYQMLMINWGLTMKPLLRKKGWLHVPPYFKIM